MRSAARRRVVTVVLCWVGLLAGSRCARAQSDARAAPPPFSWVRVVPGVYVSIEPRQYALSAFVHGNSVFVIGDSSVLAFDANRTPSAAAATIRLLRSVTDKPVRTLAISHFHADHVFGAKAFVQAFPGLRIIATDSTRDDMIRVDVPLGRRTAADLAANNARFDSLATAGVDLAGRPLTPARRAVWAQTRAEYRYYFTPQGAGLPVYLPTITFDHELKLWDGTREMELLTFGRGDTRGDAMLWLPAERVLAAGDVLVEPVPYSGAHHPSDWLRTLRAVRALNPRFIIPGHGAVQRDTRYLDLVIAVTDSTIRAVRALMTRSPELSEDDAVAQVKMEPFRMRFTHGEPLLEDSWADFLDGLVRGAYQEVRGPGT